MVWFKNRVEQIAPEQKLLNLLETHYHNNQGFYIAQEARKRLKLDPFTFIYGEINAFGLYELLQVVTPTPGEVFYDLGSGSGKAVMTAALCFPEMTAKGVEYLELMHQLSQRLSNTLLNQVELAKPQIEFINADLHYHDLSDANIVFVNATGYFDEAYQQLIDTLLQLASGTRIIISSKQLPDSYFSLVKYFPSVPMSWGHCQVNIYQRN